MLGKLIKYEFKATGRLLIPLYGALIIFTFINKIFMGDFLYNSDTILGNIPQILAILIYLIMPIKNKEMKRKYIEMFCKKFNELGVDVSNNNYVNNYLKQHNMEKLVAYISNNNIKNIEKL